METETYLIDVENHIYRVTIDLFKEMKREERSVRMKLFFLDMISDDDVV